MFLLKETFGFFSELEVIRHLGNRKFTSIFALFDSGIPFTLSSSILSETNNHSTKILSRLLGFTKPYRGRLLASVSLAIILAAMAPVRPYLIQYSVDEYIVNRLLEGLIMITLVQIGFIIVESLLRFVFMYITSWLGQTVVNDMRQKVFGKIIHQELPYFDETPIGTLTTRTVNDIEAVNNIFSEGLIAIVADVLTIIAIIGVMLYTDWKLTLVSLSIFPVLIVATYFFKESVRKSFQQVRNAVARLNAFVQEQISGMYIIQAF